MDRLNPQLSLRTHQRLKLSLSMQQSMHILEMPIEELKEYIEEMIEKNPAIDYQLAPLRSGSDPDLQCKSKSLREHLLSQAREFFSCPRSLKIMEQLIDSIDKKGFITSSATELSDLCQAPEDEILRLIKIIQTFDPPGVGARNLQESLLIQLRVMGKDQSLTYEVLHNHFSDLLNSRFLVLQKVLRKSPYEIQRTLQNDFRRLSFNPIAEFEESTIQPVKPDILIAQRDAIWRVRVYQSDLPKISVKEIAKGDKKMLKEHISQAKSLLKGMKSRKKILEDLALILIERQAGFLEGKESITPLRMAEIAEELSIHESTLARALAGKYVDCSKGIVPLKSFFSRTFFKGAQANVSKVSALETLKKLIQEEDKTHPLSDQQLVEELKKANFPCARRTVTKYRKKLSIGSARQRRQFDRDESTML